MKTIYGLSKVKKFRKPVVAMGVFDGVHRGHQKILKAAVRKAGQIKGTSIALTFWPHPQRQGLLSSLEHRLRLIGGLGIDISIVINFDKKFAKISAQDFIKEILFRRLGVNYLYIGRNFRFGRGAKGDSRTLKNSSRLYSFKLKAFSVMKAKGKPISSTYIRNLIKEGRLSLAKNLLGRPVSILGTVVRGSFLARALGFPTANIDPHHEVIPASGIYAVEIIFKAKKLNGACYIGTNPTFKSGQQRARHIEAHIFNFKKNIYGEVLEILFIKKLREEKRFASIPDLKKQIQKDIKSSLRLISRH